MDKWNVSRINKSEMNQYLHIPGAAIPILENTTLSIAFLAAA
jgi:hypothetical protein